MAINRQLKITITEDLADDAIIELPESTVGFGFIQAGDNEEYAEFSWYKNGDVLLIANSVNVANTDTDTKLCIFNNGTNAVIKNRLGTIKEIRLLYNYA